MEQTQQPPNEEKQPLSAVLTALGPEIEKVSDSQQAPTVDDPVDPKPPSESFEVAVLLRTVDQLHHYYTDELQRRAT